MKGDYTRWTFDASKPYSSVRLQQGRVLLDADWNEQQDINEYRETTTNKEIIGDGGSADLESFKVESIISEEEDKVTLGEGICYVEGILCENKAQEDEKVLKLESQKEDGKNYLIYLEVWQHHRTAIEDENLREKALNGPDTTTRTKTHWQVKGSKIVKKWKWLEEWEEILSGNSQKGKLELYRESNGANLSNDLYRVEIHKLKDHKYDGQEAPATTFKWARNNGAIAARVVQISSDGRIVTIKTNPQAQFEKGNWIEINDEERELTGLPGYFAKIDHVENNNQLILNDESELDGISKLQIEDKATTARLWGDKEKTIVPGEGEGDAQGYITLENDLKVLFIDGENVDFKYRTGDYWLIPTRSGEAVVWEVGGEEPHGIEYYYCPLAIANSSSGTWTVEKDCRKVFPALTEVFRETAVMNGGNTIKGTSLSLGVHSYNDSRRASETEKAKHTDDKLDIQGGKHLKLNVGYWKDELDGVALLNVPDATMSFCVNDQEVMSLDKDELRLEESVSINKGLAVAENLTVTGTSNLQGTVSIGMDPPEETIGLKVKPALEVPGGGSQVVGLKLEPTLTGTNNGDQLTGLHIKPDFKDNGRSELKKYGLIVEDGKVAIGADRPAMPALQIGVDLRPEVKAQNAEDKLAALYINPNFDNNGQSPVYRFGLMVEKGKVGIGSLTRTRDEGVDQHRIGVDMRPEVYARDLEDKLVGLYINPDFKDECACGITEGAKYGLIVEGGRVAFGPKFDVNGTEEYLVDIGTDGDVKRLKVAGDLEVYGKVTYHAKKEAPGDIELGQQDGDNVIVHGSLSTAHTSGKLKVTSPLEIELSNGEEDFLSLFSADENDVNGRIVWKKGTDPDVKEVAAIYSTIKGDGTEGDLRFGTSFGGTLEDRMVITAEGNVGIGADIGPDNPGTNQLKVTGTTTLDTLVVQNGLEVRGEDGSQHTEMVKLHLEGVPTENQEEREENPTLKVIHGGVCIGAESIPKDDKEREFVEEIKLYVDGIVTFAQDLNVFGKAKVNTLNVKPKLKAFRNGEVLAAVEIEPRFDHSIIESISKKKKGVGDYYQNVKRLGLHVVSGDVAIAGGGMAIGDVDPAGHKLKVTGGTTLLDGDLQVGEAAIALKVNKNNQEVGIGGASESNYKLAVAGATKIAGKLELIPTLSGTNDGVAITPTLTADGASQILTAVKIEPTFDGPNVGDAQKLGLHVVGENVALCTTSGGVAIGSEDPAGKMLNVTGETQLNGALTLASGNVDIGTGGLAIGSGAPGSGEKLYVAGGTALLTGGLMVSSGDVAIGSEDPAGHKLKVTDGTTLLEGTLTPLTSSGGEELAAAAITSTLTASADNQILTALKIAPTFDESGGPFNGVKKLGLHVEGENVALCTTSGGVAIGSDDPAGHKLHVTAGTTFLDGNLTAASGNVAIGNATVAGEREIVFPLTVKSKIKWESSVHESDFAYIFYKDDSKYSGSRAADVGSQVDDNGEVADSDKCRRLSIGIGNEVAKAYNQDALDIQGAACLTLNVGKWDREISDEFGDPNSEEVDPVGISFRVHDEQKMFIDPDGNVGIGKVPGTIVGGDIAIGDENIPDPGDPVKLDVEGIVRGLNFVQTSDAKLKENIQLLKDGLGKILGLRGVTYKWKDGKEAAQKTTEIGLVAQEVEDIFPELVSTDSQGMKSLSYSGLIAPLIEAVKEQQGQILELVQQVQQQQAQIEQLQALKNG